MAPATPELTNSQIKALKSRAHHLSAVVKVGAAGLSEPVMREIDLALKSHELIKVSAASDGREQRQAMMTQICETLGCAPVQIIGKQLIVFREKPESDEDETHVPKKQLGEQRERARNVRKKR